MPVYTYAEIEDQIKKKKLSTVYVLHGSEQFFIDQLTELFIHNILTEDEKAFNLDLVYGKDMNARQVIDMLSQYPMGAEFKMVIVKDAQDIKEHELLKKYMEQPYDSSILVLSFSDKATSKNSKYLTTAKNLHAVYESKPIYDNQMPGWIIDLVNKKHKSISQKNAQTIADNLGTDLRKVINEIDKTIIAIGDSKEITSEHIENYIGINREFNTFELISAIFNGNPYKAQLIVDYLNDNLNKFPVTVVFSLLFRSFTQLIQLRTFGKIVSEAQIIKIIESKSISQIKDIKAALNRYEPAQLENIMYLFKYYDQCAKGIQPYAGSHAEMLKECVFLLLHPEKIAKKDIAIKINTAF